MEDKRRSQKVLGKPFQKGQVAWWQTRLAELEKENGELRARLGESPAAGVSLTPCALRVLMCEYGRQTENQGYRRISNSEYDGERDELWTVARLEPIGDNPSVIKLFVERKYNRGRGVRDALQRAELELAGVVRALRAMQAMSKGEISAVNPEQYAKKLEELKSSESRIKSSVERLTKELAESTTDEFYFPLTFSQEVCVASL